MVSFVRHLPELTDEEVAELKARPGPPRPTPAASAATPPLPAPTP
jgi:hypothetical protein